MNNKSTDFKFLITLSNIIGKMAKGELEKKNIPVKIVSSGTNISWNDLRAGASSPEIFMPATPVDIYVPENSIEESKKIIEMFGWEKEEIEAPKIRMWQKVWAIFFLIIFISIIIMLLKSLF